MVGNACKTNRKQAFVQHAEMGCGTIQIQANACKTNRNQAFLECTKRHPDLSQMLVKAMEIKHFGRAGHSPEGIQKCLKTITFTSICHFYRSKEQLKNSKGLLFLCGFRDYRYTLMLVKKTTNFEATNIETTNFEASIFLKLAARGFHFIM